MDVAEFEKLASSNALARSTFVQILGDVANGAVDSDVWLPALHRAFPQADVVNLIFWGDRNRSAEEIVDEVSLRQNLFERGGEAAVQERLMTLAQAALVNPESNVAATNWAQMVLRGEKSEIIDTTKATHPSFDRVAGLWIGDDNQTLELALNAIAIVRSADGSVQCFGYRIDGDDVVLVHPGGAERVLHIEVDLLRDEQGAVYVRSG
jgi:hypothetical protein